MAKVVGWHGVSAPEPSAGLRAGDVAGKGTWPGCVALPAVARESRRVFWGLRFAWRCAIKITECDNIVRALPGEKKAFFRRRCLAQPVIVPNKRLQADRLRRFPPCGPGVSFVASGVRTWHITAAAEAHAAIRNASLRFAPLRVPYSGAAAAPPVMLPLAPLASA